MLTELLLFDLPSKDSLILSTPNHPSYRLFFLLLVFPLDNSQLWRISQNISFHFQLIRKDRAEVHYFQRSPYWYQDLSLVHPPLIWNTTWNRLHDHKGKLHFQLSTSIFVLPEEHTATVGHPSIKILEKQKEINLFDTTQPTCMYEIYVCMKICMKICMYEIIPLSHLYF